MASPIDETAADLPVRDLGINLSDSPSPQRINARKVLSRNSREELEDKYLNLHDENLLLKQHARKQEDKIKRMATKLIRLVQDKKKAEQGMGVPRRSGKDVELEEMIEQLQENVRELEKQNESLHHRLIATKQQLQTQGHRHNPYSYTQARINSGLRKVTEDVLIQENIRRGMRVQNPEVTSKSTQAALPRYGHSLLEEARSEIRNLENMVESQRSRIEELENATDILKEELQRKEKEHEETFLQLREQQTTGQRTTIKENVVIIKLQKQLAEKSRNIAEMENKFHSLQENLNTMKANQDAFLNEVDNLHSQLKEERLKSFHLEKQLQDTRFSQNRVEELLDRISDLEKERDLLKENSDKLYSSAFTVSNSQEQQRKLREQQLKFQIAQLEAALKSDLEDKNEILDRMRREREHAEKIDEENKKLQLRCLEQKHQLDEFQNKLKFFTKESDIDVTELSEALMLIKTRKQQKNDELRFLERVEDDIGKDLEKSLRELQASHAETVQELEKTRNMLIMQHKINKDYQVEVETVMQKMEGMHHDFEIKVEQYVHLLDVRAARIRRLEGQLKDIAYGTKLYKFTPEITPDDVDDSVCLERGQNIFEIHISKAVFTPAAANIFGDQDPSTFCTYAFYDFELQTTPVVRGLQPSYQFTSHYVVQVDDFFLQYIQSSTVRLEVHQAVGTDFKTIAVCQLRFHDILEKTGTIFSSSNLIGIANDIGHCGSVEYWVKLKVPMEQAIRLYRERAKALGYISSNLRDPLQNYPSTGIGKSEDNLNELFIVVNSCSSLQLETSTQQPSPYVAYTFFHFPDHYSHTIPSSNNPHFEYLKSFPVSMNAELDRYLKSESLAFYVFDDKETSDTYIGKAKVPLIPLAHDKRISGTFQLTDPKGNKTGTIQITLEWKNTYLPPKDTILAEPFIDELQKEASIPVRLLTDEEVPVPKITNKQNIPAIPMPKPRVRKPTTDKKVSFVDTSVKTPNPVNQTPDEEPTETIEKPIPVVNMSGNPVNQTGNEESSESAKNPITVLNISGLENDKLEKEEFLKNSLQENPHEINGSSLLSDGQYGAQSIDTSDDETEITEDFEGEDHDGKQTTDGNESTATDSDDCIIPVAKEVKPGNPVQPKNSSMDYFQKDEPTTTSWGNSATKELIEGLLPENCAHVNKPGTPRKPEVLEKIRIEIISLSLNVDSEVIQNETIKRLFVEYKLGNLPAEETPVSLPKPTNGQLIHYNYSNVIHLDKTNNQSKRDSVRSALNDPNSNSGSIKFIVVSDPPEDEQDLECDDIGFSYISLKEILQTGEDVINQKIHKPERPRFDIYIEHVLNTGLVSSISDSVQHLDPPEDEQDLECDDIGFSYISLKEILQTGEDVINQKIHIYESVPGTKVIGKMTVTVEAAEALRSLMKD